MTLTRRSALILATVFAAAPGLAHHGWRWTDAGEFELSGLVTQARLGNPHGELTVEANGEVWTVEVGQPWRNANAGLTDAMLAPGTEILVRGHRHADPSQRIVKAERIVIAGQTYDLYPDRS